jgi:colanic acid/amylovoran biosynthesis glycosyltransferase
MKIAVIVNKFPNISETFILNQIVDLLKQGMDVDIYAFKKSNDKKIHSDIIEYQLFKRVHFFDVPENRMLRLIKFILISVRLLFTKFRYITFCSDFLRNRSNFYQYLNDIFLISTFKKKYDIALCHFGPNGFVGSLLKKAGIVRKNVTVFHGYDASSYIKDKGRDVYESLFREGDLFLPVSNFLKDKLKYLECDEKKIIVQHMGINLDGFPYTKKDHNVCGAKIILTIGRLTEKKGHEYSIRAIAILAKKFKNIKYIIGGDGPLREDLEGLSKSLGVSENIEFLGEVVQDEVMDLYKKSDIFILPSVTAANGDQEGIPVVLMEAQAFGLPVVSTRHSGIPEVVLDGESGFIVPERDVDSLVLKVEYLLQNPDSCEKFGQIGRKIIEEDFNSFILNERLISIFKDMIHD